MQSENMYRYATHIETDDREWNKWKKSKITNSITRTELYAKKNNNNNNSDNNV